MFVFVLLEFVKDDDEFYLVRSSLILELTVLPTTVFLRLFFSSLLSLLVLEIAPRDQESKKKCGCALRGQFLCLIRASDAGRRRGATLAF